MNMKDVFFAVSVLSAVALLVALVYVDMQYSSLSAQYSSLQDSYTDLSSRYDTLTIDYQNLQSQYNSLEQNYDSLSALYDSCEQNYSSLRQDYQSLSNDYTSEVHYIYQWITDGLDYTQNAFGDIVGFAKEYEPPYYYIDPLLIQFKKDIHYISDGKDFDQMEHPHVFWTKRGGDCEDYSLAFADLLAVAFHRGYGVIYAEPCPGCHYDLSDGWYYPDMRKAYIPPSDVSAVGMICGALDNNTGHCIDYIDYRDGNTFYFDPQNMQLYCLCRFTYIDLNYYVPVDTLRPQMYEDGVSVLETPT